MSEKANYILHAAKSCLKPCRRRLELYELMNGISLYEEKARIVRDTIRSYIAHPKHLLVSTEVLDILARNHADLKLSEIEIRAAKRSDSVDFLRLVDELARFEKLAPPTQAGKKRLLQDVFSKKRVRLYLAFVNGEPAAYALYFFTYSSFLALPTLYLEDLFVAEKFRRTGIGSRLFVMLAKEAKTVGCGRMEWAVLTWNEKAINFYEKLGAKRLKDWYVYRMDRNKIDLISRRRI